MFDSKDPSQRQSRLWRSRVPRSCKSLDRTDFESELFRAISENPVRADLTATGVAGTRITVVAIAPASLLAKSECRRERIGQTLERMDNADDVDYVLLTSIIDEELLVIWEREKDAFELWRSNEHWNLFRRIGE